MTDREIERARFEQRVLRYYVRAIVRINTPSRLGVYRDGELLWDHANDKPITREKR